MATSASCSSSSSSSIPVVVAIPVSSNAAVEWPKNPLCWVERAATMRTIAVALIILGFVATVYQLTNPPSYEPLSAALAVGEIDLTLVFATGVCPMIVGLYHYKRAYWSDPEYVKERRDDIYQILKNVGYEAACARAVKDRAHAPNLISDAELQDEMVAQLNRVPMEEFFGKYGSQLEEGAALANFPKLREIRDNYNAAKLARDSHIQQAIETYRRATAAPRQELAKTEGATVVGAVALSGLTHMTTRGWMHSLLQTSIAITTVGSLVRAADHFEDQTSASHAILAQEMQTAKTAFAETRAKITSEWNRYVSPGASSL